MTPTEQELIRRQRARKRARLRRLKRRRAILISIMALVLVLLVWGIVSVVRFIFFREPVDPAAVVTPDWIDVQLLDENPYSRPGTPLERINDIVVHYTANPGTTAQQNRNYFNSLAQQNGESATSVSSHFIIGLDGEIIQCIPLSEISYASNDRNFDTVSIECCHPEADGKFTDATYQSLIRLCAWLENELKLKEGSIIRHYDVTGKLCPLYFVEHESKWNQFKEDVKDYRKQQD
ncbi:N-acetylmuramoyl-L-alanine amidase [Lachnoclostridium sp. An14]|uniref:peptidoglycan recognition protein family protein n=1 Tax=Lachnoclostridium sp. An14 TaxID=1965562 RepID=UPI000B37FAA6|nr:peptidoglycan recognition family protein [Lachnoclostridium sp. An14]OUQ21528.1 N-acetylmuramoyl-L-alanine amidase [Lachnoclostridium sp. An14]